MTNPTPQDREMAEKLFDDTLSDVGRYAEWGTPALREASIRDFAQALTTARLQGRREALEEAARALEADAQLCDCHAREAGECACGAWDDYKTVPMIRVIEIVRKLGEA